MTKEHFDVLPTWIELNVDFLRKLVVPFEIFVKVDQATTKREKLHYARVLINVKVDEEFSDQISFNNEKGIDVVFDVVYEWKPSLCSACKQLGNGMANCKN